MSPQSATAFSDLPQELLDAVIDSAAIDDTGNVDKSTLNSCSLIMRSMRFTSQKHLFSTINIVDSQLSFQNYIDIHRLPVVVFHREKSSRFIENPCAPKGEDATACLTPTGWKRQSTVEPYRNELLPTYITTLNIHANLDAGGAYIFTAVCPNLKSLEMDENVGGDSETLMFLYDKIPTIVIPPKITTLTYSLNYSPTPIAKFLSCGLDWSGLTLLHSSGLFFNAIVAHCKNLESLILEEPQAMPADTCDISYLINLRHLIIKSRCGDDAENRRTAVNTLALLKSINPVAHKLESIGIMVEVPLTSTSLDGGDFLVNFDFKMLTYPSWEDIDGALCTLAQNDRTLGIILRVNGPKWGQWERSHVTAGQQIFESLSLRARNWALRFLPQLTSATVSGVAFCINTSVVL